MDMIKVELEKDINFSLKESEVSEVVSILMEFPAGRVYNILKKLEAQSMEQRKNAKENP